MTAMAEHEQLKNGADVYLPRGLVPRQEGGALIQEGIDNIDINCQTVDGKGTFHALARVVFQQQERTNQQLEERIQHGRRKSFNSNTTPCNNLLPYRKPHKRPEPPPVDGALMKARKPETLKNI